jgi:demethylmenaquinone methyltransferase/2-methoxy-6-polyprenyl-1,4-benzoquinol methylase
VDELNELLREQAAYYRAFADGYDKAYERRSDLGALDAVLDRLPVTGDVLELACGTGQWTRLLAGRGHRVTAVDGAPEMLRRASERTAGLDVEFIRADLFDWRAPRRFDTVFFGFWLSHVPPQRLDDFWSLVAGALRPAGRACFVDSGSGDTDGEEILDEQPAPAVHRRLTDGSTRRIVKVFRDPADLERTLAELDDGDGPAGQCGGQLRASSIGLAVSAPS